MPICLQLNHCGGKGFVEVLGRQPAGPSDVLPPGSEVQPRPLSREEIGGIVVAFGEAARRAVEAGFDAVEVHGAHGYLLSQFTSPLLNTRADEYGGDFEGRLRLPLEVLAAVRQNVGGGYPVFYRLGADDLVPGGLAPEEGARIATRLKEAGVDVIDVPAASAAAAATCSRSKASSCRWPRALSKPRARSLSASATCASRPTPTAWCARAW